MWLEFLERGCDFLFDIESGQWRGMTSLHQAAQNGHAGMVKLLLRKGCLRSLEARNFLGKHRYFAVYCHMLITTCGVVPSPSH